MRAKLALNCQPNKNENLKKNLKDATSEIPAEEFQIQLNSQDIIVISCCST